MKKPAITHIKDQNNNHTVIISLRVIVGQESSGLWYAQGIDIDYVAGGLTLNEVQRNFERGLFETVKLHLERFGTLDKLVKLAPPEEWEGVEFTLVQNKPIEHSPIPFKKIEYVERRVA